MSLHFSRGNPLFSSYNIVYFILTYMVPIVAMGVCYGRIGGVLWGCNGGGGANGGNGGEPALRENACNDIAHERKLRSKRKVRIID